MDALALWVMIAIAFYPKSTAEWIAMISEAWERGRKKAQDK